MKRSASELALEEFISRTICSPEAIDTGSRQRDDRDEKTGEIRSQRERNSFAEEFNGFFNDVYSGDLSNFAFKNRVSLSLSLQSATLRCYLLGSRIST